MNKRGETTVLEEIVKAIPAIMIVLLLVWAGMKIWGLTHPEQFTTEKKDLKRIVSEIKDLKPKDNLIIPLFSTNNYVVRIIRPNEEDRKVTPSCNKEFCACFIKDTTYVCQSFDLDKKAFAVDSGGKSIDCDFYLVPVNPHYLDAQSTKNFKIKRNDGSCLIAISADEYVPPSQTSSGDNPISGSSTDPNIASATGGP